jgi:hypothetical protein
MRELIIRNIGGKKVLALFVVTNLVYVFMLTITIPKVMSFAGGMKLLDMIPTGYSPQYVSLLLKTLGENGRHAYLFNQIPIDMAYPLLFGISNCLVLAYFFNKLGKLNSKLYLFCFIPLFSGLFDYFENFGIILMLNSFPNNSVVISQTTNLFSIFKSSFTTCYFIILIIVLIVVVKNKLLIKKQ